MNKFLTTQKLYNQFASEFAAKFEKIPETGQLDEFITLLPKRARVLDLGCGSGRDAAYLTDAALHVIGVDLSEGLIGEAKKKRPDIDFRVMDMENLDFEKNSFDGIWSKLAILHVERERLPLILHSVSMLLKPNGLLMVETKQGEGEGVEPVSFSANEERYFVYYKLDELVSMLEKAGYRKVRGYEYSVDNRHATKNKDRVVVSGYKAR